MNQMITNPLVGTGYQMPYQPAPRLQYPPPIAPVPQAAPPQQNNVTPFQWVDGEVQAQSYLVAAGQTAVLWDSSQGSNRIYIKSTDQNGIPQPMRVLEYHEVTGQAPMRADTAAFVTVDEVADMINNKVEEALNKRFNERRPQRKKTKPRPQVREEDGYEE